MKDSSNLRFVCEGNSRDEWPFGVNSYEPEEQPSAPIELPAPLQFPRQNGHHRIRQPELFARFHEEFHERLGIITLNHFEVEIHRAQDRFLVTLKSAAAVVAG